MNTKRKRHSSGNYSSDSSEISHPVTKQRKVCKQHDGFESDESYADGISPLKSSKVASSPLPSDINSSPVRYDVSSPAVSPAPASSPVHSLVVAYSPLTSDIDTSPVRSRADSLASADNSTFSPLNVSASSAVSSNTQSSPIVAGSLNDCPDYLQQGRNKISESEECEARGTNTLSYMGQLTPASTSTKSVERIPCCPTWSSFRKMSVGAVSCSADGCPVPQLVWTDRRKFWKMMCRRDEDSIKVRNPDLFEYQSYVRPRMRAILLDWISEVAEVYELHRETFHLTIDYIDRYLSVVPNVQKQQLQLIGVTCLFIASKVEEIYPPKIETFATVTDGACTVEEILAMEISILQHLQWHLSPLTVNCWLEMLLQFIYQSFGKVSSSNPMLPTFSGVLFKRLSQLLDLVLLDVASLRFSYGILATSAIYILVDPDLAISVSGLRHKDIEPCVRWMSVYSCILQNHCPDEMTDMRSLPLGLTSNFFTASSPTRQKHTVSMELYDLAQAQFEALAPGKTCSNDPATLTPPPSCSKTTGRPSENEETSNCRY